MNAANHGSDSVATAMIAGGNLTDWQTPQRAMLRKQGQSFCIGRTVSGQVDLPGAFVNHATDLP
jgi:hypothetical protein